MNAAQLRILQGDFDEWWAGTWLKVGKLAAEKEYYRARRMASRETLLAGRDRYIATKPRETAWCHPVTWFRQGRWLDEMPVPQRRVAGSLQKYWD